MSLASLRLRSVKRRGVEGWRAAQRWCHRRGGSISSSYYGKTGPKFVHIFFLITVWVTLGYLKGCSGRGTGPGGLASLLAFAAANAVLADRRGELQRAGENSRC